MEKKGVTFEVKEKKKTFEVKQEKVKQLVN